MTTAQTATASSRLSQTALSATVPQYAVQGSVSLESSSPQLTAIDPYANPANPTDPLKPARPYWYSIDNGGLTILRITDNSIVNTVPWPQTIEVVQPDGSYVVQNAPAGGWEPMGMTVSYPTEEALASNSETPPTYVYAVMAHSGYEWQSNPNPPAGRDPNLRDTLAPSTNPATESAMLVQVDVTDPTYPVDLYPTGAPIAGAILGHGAGQPAFDPSVEGTVYIGNMPSTSLPTTPAVPNDLTSFVSIVSGLAPTAGEAGEVGGTPSILVLCGPEHPDIPIQVGVPVSWACLAEGGEGPFVWEFSDLPSWLIAHPDKLSGQMDGIIYGTPLAIGPYTFQARVTDNGAEPPFTSDWATVSLLVSDTAEEEPSEGGFEAGVPGAQAIEGTGSCGLAPTSSAGSMVPNWLEVVTVPGRVNPVYPTEHTIGCVVMGTAPISGEYYEFAMPNFKFPYPWDREPAPVFSGNVAGPYVFDPLPAGVGLSGLAWHQIEKIHDASTEADIINAEFFGVEPFTGQLYRILPPQGALEAEGTIIPPPETSVETDAISTYAEVLTTLKTARPDIADLLTANSNLKVKFGDLVVEASHDPKVYVSASQISDPTGTDPTVIPIGGAIGSSLPIGTVIKVSGNRDADDQSIITLSEIDPIDVPGVQAYYLGLDSNLAPAIPGSEPGQVDNGVLWVTGKNTGNVEVVDTAQAKYVQLLTLPSGSLGGGSVNPATRVAYVAGKQLQSVTTFAPGTPEQTVPVIWTAATATFTEASAGSFTVMSTGSPMPTLSYAGNLPIGVTFVNNGDGTATLAGIPVAAGIYPFTIRATNGVLPDATQAFTLTVNAPDTVPIVTTQPSNQTVTEGQMATFSAVANGSPQPTSQWQLSTDSGTTWSDISGATDTVYTTPATNAEMNGYQYRVVFTNRAGSAVSNAAILTVNQPQTAPEITQQPTNQTVTIGQRATFTAAASGSPTPTVQWQYSTNGGTIWLNISGATSANYTTPTTTMAMNGYQLRAVFTNSAGSATSNAATLTVTPATAPTITEQPTNQSVTAGQTATFKAAASGNPSPTVQWQYSTNNGATWLRIAGATSTTYTTRATTMAMNGYQLRAVFTNSAGSATSNAALLAVNPPGTAPTITQQPASQTVTAGQKATFTSTASGSPTPTIQWQYSTNGGASWLNIAGATSTTYTTPTTTIAMNGYQLRAVFTNSAGSATSNAAILTVNPPGAAPTRQ